MNTSPQVAEAIVLARTDYGEADRILTLITPDQGKLRLMAKGVRRVKSKLAGSIELFSVTNITFTKGRSDIGTLISARLQLHYGRIVQDIERTMLGYELIKQLNRATEDEPEADYFHLLHEAFAALDNLAIPLDLVKLWFDAQMLRLGGHMPNLQTDSDGVKLSPTQMYEFSFDEGTFTIKPGGPYSADHIKFLRLLFAGNTPQVLIKVSGFLDLTHTTMRLIRMLTQHYVR